MQIEEEFRDIKSSLFGLGFEHHKSRCVHRIAVLILIATLASILANIIGLAMFMGGLHRRYQANTVKVRRVLSFHYLGLRGFVDKRFKLLCEQFETAVLNLRTMIAGNSNDWIFVGIPQGQSQFKWLSPKIIRATILNNGKAIKNSQSAKPMLLTFPRLKARWLLCEFSRAISRDANWVCHCREQVQTTCLIRKIIGWRVLLSSGTFCLLFAAVGKN